MTKEYQVWPKSNVWGDLNDTVNISEILLESLILTRVDEKDDGKAE